MIYHCQECKQQINPPIFIGSDYDYSKCKCGAVTKFIKDNGNIKQSIAYHL